MLMGFGKEVVVVEVEVAGGVVVVAVVVESWS